MTVGDTIYYYVVVLFDPSVVVSPSAMSSALFVDSLVVDSPDAINSALFVDSLVVVSPDEMSY